MSYRLSFMRPVVFDPGAFGEYGGPANGGFAGTGTNNSYSSAVTWTRVISAKTVLDVRGGLNYYRNVTVDHRPGADDQHRRRHSRRQPQRLHQRHFEHQHQQLHRPAARLLGQPALGSLGEDLERHGDADPAAQLAHHQARQRAAPQQRHAAADAGCRRPARRVHLQRLGHRQPGRERVARAASPTRWRRSCSTGRRRCQRDLKVFDNPGTKHWASFWYVQDKWQARSNVTVDLGLRWEYYQPLVGLEGQGRSGQLRPRRSTRSASPATAIRTTR